MVNSSGTPVNIRLVEFATCLTIGCLLAQQQITTLGEIYVGLGIFAGLILSNTLSKRSLYPNRFFGGHTAPKEILPLVILIKAVPSKRCYTELEFPFKIIPVSFPSFLCGERFKVVGCDHL